MKNMSKIIIAGLTVTILSILAYTIRRRTKSKPKAPTATRTIDDLYFDEQDIKQIKKQNPKKIEAKLRDYSICKDYAPIISTFLFAIIVSGLVCYLSFHSYQAFADKVEAQATESVKSQKSQSAKEQKRDSTYRAYADSTLRQLERIIANQYKKKK